MYYRVRCATLHNTFLLLIHTAVVEIYFVRGIRMDAQDKEIKIKTKKIKTAEEEGSAKAKKRNRKGRYGTYVICF